MAFSIPYLLSIITFLAHHRRDSRGAGGWR